MDSMDGVCGANDDKLDENGVVCWTETRFHDNG